jgi:hypothetical protein
MPNDLLGQPVARALLVSPPDWRRTARFVATAWLLALAGIWAAQQLHQGSHESLELTPAVHLLRDTALAVPLAGLAIALGGLLATDVVLAWGLEPSGVGARIAWAVIAALVFAVLSIPGQEAHSLLFGAEQETGDWLTDIGVDAGVVLLASLVLLLPAALVGLAPWPPGAVSPDAMAPGIDHEPSAQLPAVRSTRRPALDRVGEQGGSRDA